MLPSDFALDDGVARTTVVSMLQREPITFSGAVATRCLLWIHPVLPETDTELQLP